MSSGGYRGCSLQADAVDMGVRGSEHWGGGLFAGNTGYGWVVWQSGEQGNAALAIVPSMCEDKYFQLFYYRKCDKIIPVQKFKLE